VANNVYNNAMEAKDQAGIATEQAAIATTNADEARASATQALDSANAAAASASAAAASFDAFDDRYLGAKPSDPVTDNDGNALQVGALYWNTTANEMRVWNGSSWQASAGSLVGNATTATRLQTARTITIGNTGKSFDGSADVSWSLAEIGAAGFGTLADGTDLNKVVSPGFYRLGATHGNEPPYVTHGQLIVARGGGDTILQIVTGHNNGEIYWRQGNPPDVGGPGSWSPWYRFFHSGNLGAATESSAGIVELATAAEAQAGTDNSRAVTPAGLAAAGATKLRTARTLTIGNTGKSFDGSADVSWSLAEIGAAGFGTLADGTDLNKVVSPGFYRLGATHGNEPPYVTHGQLIVARGGGDTILQIVTGHNNGEIYWRQGNPPDVGGPGSWSPWYRFFHSGNLNPTDYAPPGMVAYFARNTAPSGWLKANGAAVSRTTYAALFAAIGTTFGPGDGSTTFNLPDLRGEFLRGWDDGRGVDAGRGFGSSQGDAIRNITGSLVSALLDSVVGTGAFIAEFSDQPSGAGSGGLNKMTGVFDASRVVPTAKENRPRNVALLACIKY
jgi:hypothetical protein